MSEAIAEQGFKSQMPYIGSIWLYRYAKPCSAMVCGESIIQSRAVVLGCTMIQLLAWPQALGSLHTMLPSCAKLDPEVIAESAKRIGLQVQFVSIANWESMSDELILQSILPASITANDQIVLISEASFSKANPFAFFAGELSNFIQFHYLEYGECVVNGDVVMLVPTQKLIVLFHHEGYYSAIQFT